jgi:hypothetical protein
MVYEDAEELYGEVRVVTEALVEKALVPNLFPIIFFCHRARFRAADGICTQHDAFPLAGHRARAIHRGKDQLWKRAADDQRWEGGLRHPRRRRGRWARLAQPDQPQGARRCAGLLSVAIVDSYPGDHPADITVHSASGDSFVLGNGAVQLTVAGGRITSLFDVWLKCILFPFSPLCVRGRIA